MLLAAIHEAAHAAVRNTEPTQASMLPRASPPFAALPEGDKDGNTLYMSRLAAGGAASLAMENSNDMEEWPEFSRAVATALPTKPLQRVPERRQQAKAR